jgi:hypothetical protein
MLKEERIEKARNLFEHAVQNWNETQGTEIRAFLVSKPLAKLVPIWNDRPVLPDVTVPEDSWIVTPLPVISIPDSTKMHELGYFDE